ncbi:MAG: cytidyltransferase [Actinobacteria bacterium]|nr:cytidyltransferase [Actinomycetota bacterium]
MTTGEDRSYADSFSSDALTRPAALEPSDELAGYLDRFRSRFSVDDVLSYFERARALRVMTVGETIVDEYEYCESIGKSGKEPILAARYVSRDRFAGGILAVANQVAVAAHDVVAVTYLGERDSHESFIRSSLHGNVRLEPVYVAGAPTIVKRRFVEIYPLQKLFELYVMDGHGGELADEERVLCESLERGLGAVDVVVVADYGHGMLREQAVELLCAKAPFLAVNTQMNADNRGFNTISKYRRADFVSLSEHELRLEVRSRHRDVKSIVEEVASQIGCRTMVVTRGARGCVVFDRDEGYINVPAFTSAVVDRIGAGDAVLSIAALFSALGAPAEIIGLVSNAIGALAVGIVGNKSVVELDPVRTELKALLA